MIGLADYVGVGAALVLVVLVLVTVVTLVLEPDDELRLVVVEEEADDGDEVETGELIDALLDDGDVLLEEELEVMIVGMVIEVIEKLVETVEEEELELELELELEVGTVVTTVDVLTDVELEELVLDVLMVLTDGIVKDVLVEDELTDVVLKSSNVVVDVSVSVPHTPSQATICPPTHSVPAAVGPKLIRPPWSHLKNVRPPLPQKSWPSGEQLP